MSTGRSILSNLLVTLSAKIAVRVLGLVVMIYQMNYLGDRYGTYITVVKYVMTLLALVDLGWLVVIVREIGRSPEKAGHYLGNFFALETVVAALFAVGLIFYACFLVPDPGGAGREFVRLSLLATCGLYFGGLSRAPLGVLIARQHSGWASMADLGASLMTSVATLTVIYFKAPITAFIWINNAYYITLFFTFSIMATRVAGPMRWRIDRDIWRNLLRQSLPATLIAGTYVLYTMLDLLMLQQMLPRLFPDQLKMQDIHLTIYGVAMKYTDPLVLFVEAAMLAIYPVLSAKHGTDPAGFRFLLKKSFKLMLGLGLPISLGMVLLSEDVVKTLNDEELWPAIPTLCILVWRLPLLFAYSPMNHALLASGRLKTLASLNLIALAVNLVLNLWLIPKYYENGAAVATVASHASMLTAYLLFRKKFFGVGMPWLDVARLVASLGMMAGAVMLAHRVFGRGDSIFEILLFVLLGAAVYGASTWLFRFIGEEERPFLRQEWERRRAKRSK